MIEACHPQKWTKHRNRLFKLEFPWAKSLNALFPSFSPIAFNINFSTFVSNTHARTKWQIWIIYLVFFSFRADFMKWTLKNWLISLVDRILHWIVCRWPRLSGKSGFHLWYLISKEIKQNSHLNVAGSLQHTKTVAKGSGLISWM